jgi:cytochrome P450
VTGHLRDFAGDPLGFLTDAAHHHGPFVRMRFGRTTGYFLNSPDLHEEVLVTRRQSFVKAKTMRAQHRLLGNGLFLNEGDSWLAQRRLAQPAFHHERIAGYAGIMASETENALSRWGPGTDLDIHPELARLTIAIVARALFGSNLADRAYELGQGIESVMIRYATRRGFARLLPHWAPSAAQRRYAKGVSRIDRVVGEMIEERRDVLAASGGSVDERVDLLTMLIQARDESGAGMSDQQLRDEVVTLFVGGFDTPSLGLAWAWYLLATHPNAAVRVADEADRVLGSRQPRAEDMAELRYTAAVVKETLRLYPPAWIIGREAIEDVTIGGEPVARGSLVLMSQWVAHRDERFFGGAEEFIPERWMDGTLERDLPRFAYFPFGGGPRGCIGAGFATMEAVIVVAMIARRFRFVLAPNASVMPWPTMTLRLRHGLRVILAPREN